MAITGTEVGKGEPLWLVEIKTSAATLETSLEVSQEN